MKIIIYDMLTRDDTELIKTQEILDEHHPLHRSASERAKDGYAYMALAKHAIPRHTAIGLYGGSLDLTTSRQRKPDNYNRFYIYDVEVLPVSRNRSLVSTTGMMNDPRGMTRMRGKKVNVVAQPFELFGVPCISHIALRDIDKHEEVLVNYGETFWGSHDWKAHQEKKLRHEMEELHELRERLQLLSRVKQERDTASRERDDLEQGVADKEEQIAALEQQLEQLAQLQRPAKRSIGVGPEDVLPDGDATTFKKRRQDEHNGPQPPPPRAGEGGASNGEKGSIPMGFMRYPSGAYHKVVQESSGRVPTPSDRVRFDEIGWDDGFDGRDEVFYGRGLVGRVSDLPEWEREAVRR
mmetsp:Transcript_37356/g.106902  ORF Transcript_37356/g.106902 Transcript_37356/m.106902 type:complete len:352 (+) Transcript_37356:412-1467(+)